MNISTSNFAMCMLRNEFLVAGYDNLTSANLADLVMTGHFAPEEFYLPGEEGVDKMYATHVHEYLSSSGRMAKEDKLLMEERFPKLRVLRDKGIRV